jgi:hypothetical protein
VSGNTVVAYINVWPTTLSPRGGYTEYVTSTDGLTWAAPKKLPMSDGSPMNGVFEQDPHSLPDGRILNAAHFQPGVTVAPVYTDDPSGLSGWRRAPFQSLAMTAAGTRELEPSWYRRADGAIIMVFRDQNSTFHKLASLSADRGQTWTLPVETNMPDSRAKQSAGNLTAGRHDLRKRCTGGEADMDGAFTGGPPAPRRCARPRARRRRARARGPSRA